MNTTSSIQQPHISPLARLRILKGLTQEQLATGAGIDRAELSRIERGIRTLSFSKRARIAQVLGCTPEELYARLQELANG